MCYNTDNKEQSILKKISRAVKSWVAFIFILFSGIVSTILTLVNNALKNDGKPIVEIPWWIWLVVAVFFVLIGVCIIFVVRSCFEHHLNHHNAGTKCDERLDETCQKCKNIQEKYVEDCNNTIEKINTKISEQDKYVSDVRDLMSNVQQLGKMFTAAVGQRLRTNKQVAEIEANAVVGSQIFIMTAYFFLEMYNDDMRESMVNNINRGVKYRYIIPYEKKDDFKRMVHFIFAHPKLKSEYRESNENTFLTASFAKKEFFMLTVAYYEINDTPLANSPSAVIVKLPAEDISEATDENATIYLVPEGQKRDAGNQGKKGRQTKKENSEHTKFKDSLSSIYNMGIDSNNPELAFTASKLISEFPEGIDGVKIIYDKTT